jgi:hypothetical protein
MWLSPDAPLDPAHADIRSFALCRTFRTRTSDRLDTDPSLAVRPIASPIKVAIESTRMLPATHQLS